MTTFTLQSIYWQRKQRLGEDEHQDEQEKGQQTLLAIVLGREGIECLEVSPLIKRNFVVEDSLFPSHVISSIKPTTASPFPNFTDRTEGWDCLLSVVHCSHSFPFFSLFVAFQVRSFPLLLSVAFSLTSHPFMHQRVTTHSSTAKHSSYINTLTEGRRNTRRASISAFHFPQTQCHLHSPTIP